MRRIERSALIPYSAETMFDLVNDVESYPAFLPWCRDSELLQCSALEVVARLELSGGGLRKSFTTRNTLRRPERIDLTLVQGPFRSLDGTWRFTRLNDNASKIELTLRFDVDNRGLNLALSKVFDAAADKLVDAFCERAAALHG